MAERGIIDLFLISTQPGARIEYRLARKLERAAEYVIEKSILWTDICETVWRVLKRCAGDADGDINNRMSIFWKRTFFFLFGVVEINIICYITYEGSQ